MVTNRLEHELEKDSLRKYGKITVFLGARFRFCCRGMATRVGYRCRKSSINITNEASIATKIQTKSKKSRR